MCDESLSLPPLTGDPPVLPAKWPPYQATFDELEQVFVRDAPYSEERALRFSLLRQHAAIVKKVVGETSGRLWINGGFLTHKAWRRPSDIDVVYFVPRDLLGKLSGSRGLSLWTLSKVGAKLGGGDDAQEVDAERLLPMGGFVDAYLAPDSVATRNIWARQWSSIKGEDGSILVDKYKGFVEVTLNDE